MQYPLLLFEQLAVLYGSCALNWTHWEAFIYLTVRAIIFLKIEKLYREK